MPSIPTKSGALWSANPRPRFRRICGTPLITSKQAHTWGEFYQYNVRVRAFPCIEYLPHLECGRETRNGKRETMGLFVRVIFYLPVLARALVPIRSFRSRFLFTHVNSLFSQSLTTTPELSEALASVASLELSPSPDATTLLEFERRGHIVTRNLFSEAEMKALQNPIREVFRRREFDAWLNSARVMLGEEAIRDDFGEPLFETSDDCRAALDEYEVELPFLQIFNGWREDPVIRAIACSPRLARTAAKLLGVDRVRLYQDSMFLKRPGDATDFDLLRQIVFVSFDLEHHFYCSCCAALSSCSAQGTAPPAGTRTCICVLSTRTATSQCGFL